MSNLVLWNSQGYGFLEYRLKKLGFAEFTKLKWFLFLTASGKFDTLHAGNYNHFFFWKGTEHLSQTLYLYSLLLALQPDILNCKLCRPDSQIVKFEISKVYSIRLQRRLEIEANVQFFLKQVLTEKKWEWGCQQNTFIPTTNIYLKSRLKFEFWSNLSPIQMSSFYFKVKN